MTAPDVRMPAGGPAFTEQETTDTSIVVDLDAERKAFLKLVAAFAMAGFELHQAADGTLVVWRWNLSRTFADLAAVEAFLARVGGRNG